MSFPPSALSADDGAVLQKLMLARPGKSWISDNESSGSLLLRIRLQNNNTKLETQSKVIPSEQGVQKRYEAVELRYRGPGVISCEDLVPVG